jgi:putative SOS response-associated peptidase YedK
MGGTLGTSWKESLTPEGVKLPRLVHVRSAWYAVRMCGRVIRTGTRDILAASFGVLDASEVEELRPSWNIPPTRAGYVVGYNAEERRRGLAVMKWGLVPRWWRKSLKEATKPFNATAEGVHEKPTFRDAFKKRRCLVPINGFYEWRKSDRQAFCFRPVGSETFALAGLWDSWSGLEAEKLLTFTVVTTTPNELVGQVHNRMPVILPPERWDEWLSPDTTPDEARSMLTPFSAERMVAFEVGPLVGSVRNDGPELVEPVSYC